MNALAEALGDSLGLAPVDVAEALPAALAGIGRQSQLNQTDICISQE